jgi:crotonobetainyl-CoA:carnitine CoA-transferase CaiB-like acyl-CoA transferase
MDTQQGKPPLAGLRVVELARILAGPWIGQTLADLGADVIKVESPEGDDTRRWGPPFVSGEDGAPLDAAYFHCCNRGKRSVVADFTAARDLELVQRLADRADVLIENFRTGGLARFGLDYASVRARNPRIVYCSVTGFGQDGPYARRPGYDAIIQGMGGMMDITGAADGPPQKVGVAIADIFTGVYGVIGVQAALAQRERTGLGQQVDMALLDSMVAVLANQAMNYFVSGTAPHRMGSGHPNLVPYQDFRAADGHVMIAVGSDAQFTKLCAVLGLAALGADERFRSNAGRVRHRAALIPQLQAAVGAVARDALLARLEVAGIPAGPINGIDDVFRDPQLLFRRMRVDLPATGAAGGTVPGLRTPIVLSESQLRLERASPRLGEHTAEVARELGLEWPSPRQAGEAKSSVRDA